VKILNWASLALLLAPASYGAVIGPFNISGSVMVSTTVIDWTSPFTIGGSVGGTFAGTAGTTGNALDLVNPTTVPPQANFLTFNAPSLATVHYDIISFIPGVALPCTGFEAVNQSCTLPGGVFTATATPTGTTIGMQMNGLMNDVPGFLGATQYLGSYTTQIGSTIAQILLTLAGGPGIPGGAAPPVPAGFISTTYSASFDAIGPGGQNGETPEPATFAMIGAGLVGVWAMRARSARAARQ
jgi:hypothetical protein